MYSEALEKYINTLTFHEYKEGDMVLPYRLSVPADYKEKKYPVVMFLHGAGERGNDNDLQLRTALPVFLESNPVVRDAIYVIPQCALEKQWVNTPWAQVDYSVEEVEETWYLASAVKVLLSVCEEYNADCDRRYVFGISMGGYGTWDAIMRHGDLFAAAMPICGGADPTQAEKVKDIPIHTFHGNVDSAVPVQGTRHMVEAIKALGGKIIYTEYEGVDHNSWDPACSFEGIGEWMFSQKRSDRA